MISKSPTNHYHRLVGIIPSKIPSSIYYSSPVGYVSRHGEKISVYPRLKSILSKAFSFKNKDFCKVIGCKAERRIVRNELEKSPSSPKILRCRSLEKYISLATDEFSTECCVIQESERIFPILYSQDYPEGYTKEDMKNDEKAITIDPSALCDKKGKITASGDGGEVAGSKDFLLRPIQYLKDFAAKNPTKKVHIFSLGSGVGYDAKMIHAELKKQKKLKLSGFTCIDNNVFALHQTPYKNNFKLMNVFEFLRRIGPRKEDEIRLFHLGNLINVIDAEKVENLLKLLSKKTEESDIFTALCLKDSQFKDRAGFKPKPETKGGLTTFTLKDKMYKTTVSDKDKLQIFLEGLDFHHFSSDDIQKINDLGQKSGVKIDFIKAQGVKK